MNSASEVTPPSPKEQMELAYKAFKVANGARVALTAEAPGSDDNFPALKVEFLNLKNGQTVFALIRQTDSHFNLYWSGLICPDPFVIDEKEVSRFLEIQQKDKVDMFTALFVLELETEEFLQEAAMQVMKAKTTLDSALRALGDSRLPMSLRTIEFQGALNNVHGNLMLAQGGVLEQIRKDVRSKHEKIKEPKKYE